MGYLQAVVNSKTPYGLLQSDMGPQFSKLRIRPIMTHLSKCVRKIKRLGGMGDRQTMAATGFRSELPPNKEHHCSTMLAAMLRSN